MTAYKPISLVLGGPSWGPLCCTPHRGEASPSSLSRKAALRLSPHCHLRSLSPVRGSLSWAALLSLPPSVKRCSRAGLPSSRSLWCCCTRWVLSFAHALPSLRHSHLSSLPRQPNLFECRLYHQRGFGVHPGGASD